MSRDRHTFAVGMAGVCLGVWVVTVAWAQEGAAPAAVGAPLSNTTPATVAPPATGTGVSSVTHASPAALPPAGVASNAGPATQPVATRSVAVGSGDMHPTASPTLRWGGRVAKEIEKGKPAATPKSVSTPVSPVRESSTAEPARPVVVPSEPRSGDAADQFIDSHIHLGTRVTWFILDDRQRHVDMSDSFYGSITELRACQDMIPYKLFADVMLNPYVGVEVTWDRIQADTITRSDGHNDGTLDLKGPMASLLGRYPNASRFTPYGGVGLAWFKADFKEDPLWQRPYGDFEQEFDMDDTWGWIVSLGLSARIWEQWSADLYYRHTGVSVDGVHWHWYHQQPTSSFTFPLSNEALGLGVRYEF